MQHEEKTILFMVLTGSRAFGYETENSDYDYRGVFVYPIKKYLSWKHPGEVIEYKRDNRDYVLWDLRKFAKLLVNSNPTVGEWLHSPVVNDKGYIIKLRDIYDRGFSTSKLKFHYINIIRSNLKIPTIKSTIQMVRAYAYLRYIIENEKFPPLNLKVLGDYLPPGSEYVLYRKEIPKETLTELKKILNTKVQPQRERFNVKEIENLIAEIILEEGDHSPRRSK